MKKKLALLILGLSFLMSACAYEDNLEDAKNNPTNETIETVSTVEETLESNTFLEYDENISNEEKIIRKRITEQYASTDIDSIVLNENNGAETDENYIALVNLTWNVKNHGKTSKEMLQMYSNDLAYTVANECPNIQEIAIFWKVPYLDDNAKCSYERKGNAMYEMDMVWGNAFND